MNYDILFATMGTALIFFIYKTISLHKELRTARDLVIGIALGDMVVKVNHQTHEIDLKWKEDK